jgi:hypothetical protein
MTQFESFIVANGKEQRVPGEPLTRDNVLEYLQQCAEELTAAAIPSCERWLFLPAYFTDPHRSRRGRRSKKRVQKKLVICPAFLKGTRWWRGKLEEEK